MRRKEILTIEKGGPMQVLNRGSESNNMLTALAAYICLFYPLTDLGLGNIIGWTFLLGYWIFSVLSQNGKLYINKNRLGYVWIVVVVVVYFFMPNARRDLRSMQALIITIMICALYILSIKTSREDIFRVARIFVTAGIIFSIFLIICRIFPSLYLNSILPLLRGADVNGIRRLSRLGYGAHIANSLTYGPYIISVASLFCLGDMLLDTKLYTLRRTTVYQGLFVVAILCEGRRGELVGLIIAALVVYVVSTPNSARKVFKRFGGLIAISLVAVVLITILMRHGYLTRFVNTFDLLKSGVSTNDLNKLTSSRYYLWENAWNLFTINPIFGIGWGNFSNNVVSVANNVHNCYLQFLCEIGIVGFLLIIIPMLSLFIGSLRKLKVIVHGNSRNNIEGVFLILSVGMQVYFLLLFALDPVFYKGYFHLLYIILIVIYDFSFSGRNQKI